MDQYSVAFPEGAVVCTPRDYLICRHLGEGWQVYRVEDLLMVKRLIPRATDPPTLIIEEHLLDSMAPAYFNEVQLLLTALDPKFAGEQEALQAIYHQTLTERVEGLLRPIREFTEPECRVVHPASTP
jgi:hypothetical protein